LRIVVVCRRGELLHPAPCSDDPVMVG
jgi:hypothetical protein